MVKQTSDKWLEKRPGLILMDPDGWDRANWQFSFYEEEITEEEFTKRLRRSTSFTHAATVGEYL